MRIIDVFELGQITVTWVTVNFLQQIWNPAIEIIWIWLKWKPGIGRLEDKASVWLDRTQEDAHSLLVWATATLFP